MGEIDYSQAYAQQIAAIYESQLKYGNGLRTTLTTAMLLKKMWTHPTVQTVSKEHKEHTVMTVIQTAKRIYSQ